MRITPRAWLFSGTFGRQGGFSFSCLFVFTISLFFLIFNRNDYQFKPSAAGSFKLPSLCVSSANAMGVGVLSLSEEGCSAWRDILGIWLCAKKRREDSR
jgi:hypothetical protein